MNFMHIYTLGRFEAGPDKGGRWWSGQKSRASLTRIFATQKIEVFFMNDWRYEESADQEIFA